MILCGLAAIQIYLVRNTYRLTTASYRNAVNAALLKLESDPVYKRIRERYDINLTNRSKDLISGKTGAGEFRTRLRHDDLVISGRLDRIVKAAAKLNGQLSGVSERLAYSAITITGAGRTMNPVYKPGPLLSLSPTQQTGAGNIVGMGENTGNIERTGTAGELHIAFSMVRQLDIPSLPMAVFRQLALVGGLSFLLLLAVVVLFYLVLRSAQRQRKIAELRADLVNNITHELKTPLSSMAIAFKTLKHPATGRQTSQQKEVIAAMERQHHKLNETVERVLESAVHKLTENTRTADIVSILRHYGNNMIAEDYPVSVAVGPGPCLVRGSEGLIESVIDNLIENARKYTEPGSPIGLSGKAESYRYRVDVTDSGKGIAEEFQKHLFEKFYRVPEKDLHSVKGLGLGLYLSRKAAQSIGGEVLLSSSSPCGSVFTLYLSLV